jgi:thienamycin biosynthesis protein ThnN
MQWDWRTSDSDAWLRHVVSMHFDPDCGSPYWLKKESTLGIDARKEIRAADDLRILGPMAEEDLASVAVEEFIPKRFLEKRSAIFTAESAGTTGLIKTTAYRTDEFRAAFADFLRAVGRNRNFPGHLNWLFVGPSGPHIIHRSAIEMALSFGAMEPFAIDFDPRWAKKLPRGSVALERYKAHILEQAVRIIETQNIGILFSTPDLALSIADAVSASVRGRIRGMHLGGLPLTPAIYEKIDQCFPEAVIIPGYGNTLFGLTLEVEPHDREYNVVYYPPGPRLRIEVCHVSGVNGSACLKKAAYGETGRIVAHRLDEAFFIANLIERDEAERVLPKEICTAPGRLQDGIKNPLPAKDYTARDVQEGLY